MDRLIAMNRTMKKDRVIQLALVCTMGGHFEQMTNLFDFYSHYNHFWITNRNKQTEGHLENEKVYYIDTAHFKKPWTYLNQMMPVLKILRGEKPTHILSTGSGRTALIPFLLSRLLGIKFIYIDTFSRVQKPSLFGSFVLNTRNKIYTQWEQRTSRTIYIGPILRKEERKSRERDANFVFVTLGTREEPFPRLLKCVEDLVKQAIIKEKVIVQAGHTKYSSEHLEMFDFCMPERIDDLISNAVYVITQESAGIGTQCLKNRTKFVVMPREYQYGELPAKSDMDEDLHYKLEELGYAKVVRNTQELKTAIINMDRLNTGFEFDNSLAISILHKAVGSDSVTKVLKV